MKLAKSSIGIAALAALLGSAGLKSDVEAGVNPTFVQFSNAGPVSCNGPPGGTCTITPAVSYNTGALPPDVVKAPCCDEGDCSFISHTDVFPVNVNGNIISSQQPFTFNTSNTPGQALRYQVELVAYCELVPSNLLHPLVDIYTQPFTVTYIVTNGG